MSSRIRENTYDSAKDFAKILHSNVLDAFDRNNITIDEIYVKDDPREGSSYTKITISYEGHKFTIDYEEPDHEFKQALINYIQDLEFDIDCEAYKVDKTFDKKFIKALYSVLDDALM